MTSQTLPSTSLSYHSAGLYAIVSGSIGILSFALLITAVSTRTTITLASYDPVYLLFKAHDVGVILQFLLMIPVASSLFRLSKQQTVGISQSTLRLGIGAACFTGLFLILGIFLIISDGLYTVPQAIFGVWMIIVCGKMLYVLSKGLRWFGKVVGLGLIIVGLFFPLYAIFVSPVILQIPAADPSDPANFPEHFTFINQNLHYLLHVGSIMGVATLPIWTILIGRRLIREGKI
jgi:hypothetical protein